MTSPRLAFGLLPLIGLCVSPAMAGKTLLADNAQVLSVFGQATGTAPPALVTQDDGGTRIEWQGGVGVDLYDNRVTVPAATGNLTSPHGDGGFHRIQLTGDLRRHAPEERLAYLQFMATQSNDPAVQRHQVLVNSFQAGHATPSTQFAFGDVNADFTALGTSLGVRGLLAAARVGESTVSAVAGTLAPTWNAVMDEGVRTEYLRNVISAKIDTPLTGTTRAFVSLQGYADDAATLSLDQQALLPASGRAATLGFNHQAGAFALGGELGYSRWSPEGQSAHTDHALVIDGSWTAAAYSLRAGHHDLGGYYTSLSAQAQPGIRETYLAGTWQAAPWLGLQGDLRRSENLAANTAGGAAAVRTDGASFTENIGFGANWPGLGLTLLQAVSNGENPDGSDNRQWGYGANLGYATQMWNGALGYNRRTLKNEAPAGGAGNGTTEVWSAQLGRNLMDDPANPTWVVNLGANASWQDQSLDAGGNTKTTQVGVNVSATRQGLGTLGAGITLGWVEPNPAGNELKNLAYTLEATHPFKGDRGSVKLYARDTRNHSGNAALKNTARTLGIQLALAF